MKSGPVTTNQRLSLAAILRVEPITSILFDLRFVVVSIEGLRGGEYGIPLRSIAGLRCSGLWFFNDDVQAQANETVLSREV